MCRTNQTTFVIRQRALISPRMLVARSSSSAGMMRRGKRFASLALRSQIVIVAVVAYAPRFTPFITVDVLLPASFRIPARPSRSVLLVMEGKVHSFYQDDGFVAIFSGQVRAK